MGHRAVYGFFALFFFIFPISCSKMALKPEKPLQQALSAHSNPPVYYIEEGVPVNLVQSYAEALKRIINDSWYKPTQEEIIAVHNCILSRLAICFGKDHYLHHFPPRDPGRDLVSSSVSDSGKENCFRAELINRDIGYLRFCNFEWEYLVSGKMEGISLFFAERRINKLLFDLRGNSGGYLRTAVEVLRKFAPESGILIMVKEYRKEDDTGKMFFRADEKGEFSHWRIAVLVDGKTASAAEIVAGVLQLWGARLFGTRTYGKGSIGKEISLPDGGMLLLTTGRYFLADGFSPEGRGIEPDEIVEDRQEQFERALAYLKEHEGD